MGNLILCGNVGEEGLGDLRGCKELFRTLSIDAFLSLDHWGVEDILLDATGSRRYQITYSAEGGHSFGAFGPLVCCIFAMTGFGAFGKPNPIHAMGRAIGAIAQLEGKKEPKTTFNVGVVSGGASVNSIASQAQMLVDIRSNSAQCLAELEGTILELARQAAQQETDHWKHEDSVKIDCKLIGDRPAGTQDHNGLMAQTFGRVMEALGKTPRISEPGSTDCNVLSAWESPPPCWATAEPAATATIPRNGIGRTQNTPVLATRC